MKITCTNGNARNGIKGSRVRFTCEKCGTVYSHLSPVSGPAGYYEAKHPTGRYAEHYRMIERAARLHVC